MIAMRLISILCLGLSIGLPAAARDDVSATPTEVLEFREAAPNRAPAAVNATGAIRSSSIPEISDQRTEAGFCVLCPVENQAASESLHETGKKIREATLREK